MQGNRGKIRQRTLVGPCTKSRRNKLEGKVNILWDEHVRTDRTVPNSKPNFIIRDNKQVTCMLIDVESSEDITVINKEAEKILKHKDLIIETKSMWNVKAKVISVKTGATGTISVSVRQYLSNIPGKNEVKELRTTAMLGTAHKLREVLM